MGIQDHAVHTRAVWFINSHNSETLLAVGGDKLYKNNTVKSVSSVLWLGGKPRNW